MVPADRRRMHYIAGQGYSERLRGNFNGRFWDECLNDTLFSTLSKARSAISSWKEDRPIAASHRVRCGVSGLRSAGGHVRRGSMNFQLRSVADHQELCFSKKSGPMEYGKSPELSYRLTFKEISLPHVGMDNSLFFISLGV